MAGAPGVYLPKKKKRERERDGWQLTLTPWGQIHNVIRVTKGRED